MAPTALSAIAHAIGQARVYEAVHSDREAFLARVAQADGLDLTPLALAPGHFVTTDPYNGPASLDFLRETSIRDLLDEGLRLYPTRPTELLAKTIMSLGPTARDATRHDAQSTVQIFATQLSGQVVSYARLGAAASAAAVAAQVPKLLRTSYAQIVADLRYSGVRPGTRKRRP